jgi:tRNA (guanine37-N1)-methyltransferase
MRADIVTLFPEIFEGFLQASFVGRGRAGGQLDVRTRSPRDFGLGKHRSVDDTPYGGGSGLVMRVDVMVACMESLDADAPVPDVIAGDASAPALTPSRAHRVLLTPQGRPLDQACVRALAARPALMLICGRYEGFDERIRAHVDEEVSLGDFVMTGGEVAAMAIIEACVRLLPGVLGNQASTHEESHGEGTMGLLEYPQFTRPAEFRGAGIPDALLSGHHAEIEKWRRQEAERRTKERRPDIFARYEQALAALPRPARKKAR